MTGLNYEDIYLIPNYSNLKSRDEVNLYSSCNGLELSNIPVISANMASVTGFEMAAKMLELGGTGIVHRFFENSDEFLKDFKKNHKIGLNFFDISIGVKNLNNTNIIIEGIKKALEYSMINNKNEYDESKIFNSITIDIAHGDHKLVLDTIEFIKNKYPTLLIIAGNICTFGAAVRLINTGADILKVGIGPGSACTTRLMTGFGTPQVTAIIDVKKAINKINPRIGLIADGGIEYVADIVKALAVGADAVMIGKLFAGCKETPGIKLFEGNWPNQKFYKNYFGSASFESKQYQKINTNHVEGINLKVPYSGSVEYIIKEIKDGLTSAFSYAGVNNLKDFQKNIRWDILK